MAPQPQSRASDEAPAGYMSLADAEAMITAKLNEATAAMMDLFASKQAGGGGVSDARAIALAIAEISNQGKRNAVPPEEMERRESAMVKMFALVNELNEAGEVMEYRLNRKVVLEDANGPQIIDPLWIHPVTKQQMHTTLQWADIPNEAMEPVNDNAKRVFELFSMWIGGAKKRTDRMRVTPKGVVIVEGSRAHNNSAVPLVAGPKGGAPMRITGRGNPSEQVVQTAVLGTIAKPAMQVNGRAAA